MRTILTPTDLRQLGEIFGQDSFGCFACPIPGHGGDQSRFHADGDTWLLCECHDKPRERSLGEVWAARAYGRDLYLHDQEQAVWWRRLAYDLGSLEPVEVVAPELPSEAPPELHHVRNGFRLLCGLRTNFPEVPVPFSVPLCRRMVRNPPGYGHGRDP